MLLLMMELKGRFNVKMIKRAKFGDSYFDEMGGFDSVERDRVSGTVSLCSLIGANRGLICISAGRRTKSTHLETES